MVYSATIRESWCMISVVLRWREDSGRNNYIERDFASIREVIR